MYDNKLPAPSKADIKQLMKTKALDIVAREVIVTQLAIHGSIDRAATVAGVRPSAVKRERRDNPGFAELCDDAMAVYKGILAEHASRLALGASGPNPITKPVLFKGVRTGEEEVVQCSPTLGKQLIAHLREYDSANRKAEIAATGQNVQVVINNYGDTKKAP